MASLITYLYKAYFRRNSVYGSGLATEREHVIMRQSFLCEKKVQMLHVLIIYTHILKGYLTCVVA